MKLTYIIFVVGLIALGATEILLNLTNVGVESLGYQNLILGARGSDPGSDPDDDDDDDSDVDDEDDNLNPADDELWYQCKCRGAKLLFAMTQNPPEAARFLSPLASPWDGEMREELAEWGYKDNFKDPDLFDFSGIAPYLATLGIPITNSLHGGPNHCVSYSHCNSDIVRDENGDLPPLNEQYYTKDGRKYRVTAAHGTMVINPSYGYILFLNRGSPQAEARETWGIRDDDPVPLDELPALRASSDIAWAYWNRIQDGDKLNKIKFFASMSIINSETEQVIDRILKNKGLDEVPPNPPGFLVTPESEDYLALMGSPNAIGVGYFLAQHKAQLGSNYYVQGIRIYRKTGSSLSNMIFAVGLAPSPPPTAPPDPMDVLVPPPGSGMEALTNTDGGRVIKRSGDGKNIVRSHKVWIKS